MTDKPPEAAPPSSPPLKPLSLQDWESLIDDFQHGGARQHKWTSAHPIRLSLLDQALSSLARRDFPLKLHVITFLEEFCDPLFTTASSGTDIVSLRKVLHRLIETLRALIQTPPDGVHITFALKEQMMLSVTSIVVSLDDDDGVVPIATVEGLVELLLTVINRPNHGIDRQARALACECLRELEKSRPCLLSEIGGHLWSLSQNERTHAAQSYILLFTTVVHNIVVRNLGVSILNTTVPLVPFSAPQNGTGPGGLNHKELRRAMAFLLEWPHVLTPCAMVEFLALIMPIAAALDLQASMLKVQFFGMVYSSDPMLAHVVLTMYPRFWDAFDGQEGDIVSRLVLLSRESQHHLVFRLLAVHWLLGFGQLVLKREAKKVNTIVDMGSRFYPSVFDPLALKAMKLDLLAFCSVCADVLKSETVSVENGGVEDKLVVKLFEDGLVCVSAFKWLPPGSTETAVAFRTLHRFLIGASSHSDNDPSTTRSLMDSTTFSTIQGMLVDLMLECRRLVPVVVALTDRLLGCQKHRWLGERLLQTFDQHLLPKVKLDYNLVSFFPIFDRIAESDTIPPRGLLELLIKFMAFLVGKHGPYTGLRSWSQGSRVLGICRTLLMHHNSSRLFLRLSRLLAFTCLYFPDLEVRDNARIYLRILICVPGKKLRDMLNLGEQLGISPSSHSSFNVQAPRFSQSLKKSRNISSYVHFERVIPLLVKQSWSLSLSSLGVGSTEPGYPEGIRDIEPIIEDSEIDDSSNAEDSSNVQIIEEAPIIDRPQEPLRVTDSKISEILGTLRRHFSCIPDFRHMPGLKVRLSCSLRFESEPFSRIWGVDSPAGVSDELDALPALYATVLKFSSSAPYGPIASYHIPFLLGEPPRKTDVSGQTASLAIVPVENGSGEEESFRAPVAIELEPREPTPGLIDVSIETNAENGQIISGQLHSITVGIEDMFLKSIVPPDIQEDATPVYYLDLFTALWEACGTANTARETFQLKGGKGVTAISGTRSVKLLEVPASSLIQATERYLAPFVVSVIGEPLINIVKDAGIIRNVIWKDAASDSSLDITSSGTDFDRGPPHLTYTDDEDERDSPVNIRKRNMGCFLILIFLPPRFHLLFQMEVSDVSTLVRIRTDHWPCLAYTDDYLEALFLA
ncbi:unnamed protein product [Prunus armeniaca]|uniref:Uncharacterized protein n=1 Tax=Prunus armeniaca TaxID=36596 RepID=A0A6J5U2D6_PRUAR|nr:unnamed protein product [Prunus armeniaca]CAB4300921.1 unnamed protein product [Prunus armeniaca]